MWVDKDGNKISFPQVVEALLVEEMGHDEETASRLVKQYPSVVTNGIMNNMNYRATAMALEMKLAQEDDADG